MNRIGFIGAGNIAQALAKGFIAAGKQVRHFGHSFVNKSCIEICRCFTHAKTTELQKWLKARFL